MDSDWDKRVFNSNWKTDKSTVEKADDLSAEGADSLENVQRGKKRSRDTLQNCRKNRKVEVEQPENKVVWGEELAVENKKILYPPCLEIIYGRSY